MHLEMDAHGRLKLSRPRNNRRHKPGEMNRTEAAYAEHLEFQKRAGEVEAYWFEGIKLRLAPATFFTADFLVQLKGGELVIDDVKGATIDKETGRAKPLVEDDAMVKIKLAAELFTFRVRIVYKTPKVGLWLYQEIGA